MIEPGVLPLRKEIRDEPVPDVGGERAQDVPRLAPAAGDERQSLQADHRVAAPVGEPVIAGDDRARLIAHGPHPRFIRHAGMRMDEELIGGQHELGALRIAARCAGDLEQPLAPG